MKKSRTKLKMTLVICSIVAVGICSLPNCDASALTNRLFGKREAKLSTSGFGISAKSIRMRQTSEGTDPFYHTDTIKLFHTPLAKPVKELEIFDSYDGSTYSGHYVMQNGRFVLLSPYKYRGVVVPLKKCILTFGSDVYNLKTNSEKVNDRIPMTIEVQFEYNGQTITRVYEFQADLYLSPSAITGLNQQKAADKAKKEEDQKKQLEQEAQDREKRNQELLQKQAVDRQQKADDEIRLKRQEDKKGRDEAIAVAIRRRDEVNAAKKWVEDERKKDAEENAKKIKEHNEQVRNEYEKAMRVEEQNRSTNSLYPNNSGSHSGKKSGTKSSGRSPHSYERAR